MGQLDQGPDHRAVPAHLRRADIPEEPVSRPRTIRARRISQPGNGEADRAHARARRVGAARPGLTARRPTLGRGSPPPGPVDGPFRIGLNEVKIGLTVPWFAIELARQRLHPAHFDRTVVNATMYSPHDAVTGGFLDGPYPPANSRPPGLPAAAELAGLDATAHAATKLRARGATPVAPRPWRRAEGRARCDRSRAHRRRADDRLTSRAATRPEGAASKIDGPLGGRSHGCQYVPSPSTYGAFMIAVTFPHISPTCVLTLLRLVADRLRRVAVTLGGHRMIIFVFDQETRR